MNASFRTAFWAMCLGLTVPMVLFIGVELISPGSTTRKVSVAAADRTESLQTRLQTRSAKPGKGRPQTAESNSRASTAPVSGNSKSKPTTSRPQAAPGRNAAGPEGADSEPADPQVVLGPELEPDQATADLEPEADHRVPAVAAHTRPRVRILPDIEPVPANDGRTNSAIEERLAGIQNNLDRIGRTLDAQIQREQVPREPPVDPVKQVTELLRQLHETRPRDASTPLEEPVKQTPADEKHDSSDAPKRTASLPPDTVQETAQPESNHRNGDRKPQLVTRMYRPRYLSGSALKALVEPLLTRDLGKTGAADADSGEPATGGGNSTGSPANALVVRDVPEVMRKIDELIVKIDVPPTRVSLEAVVITLQLNANLPHGIDLRGVSASGQSFTVSPVDAGAAPLATGGLTLSGGFGLKCGVLTGDPQAFIGALERAAQVRSARAWQMTVVNRQSAGLMLNDPFGSAGSGNESAAETILKCRPVVDRAGLVHLDIRRDVHLDGPGSGNGAAALTHQIALQNGQTAIVGGFFAEQTALQYYRRPGIGQFPLVGGLFLKEVEVVERCETIVLLTPHVSALGAEADSQYVRKQPPRDQSATSSPTTHVSYDDPPARPRGSARPILKQQ